MGEVAERIGTHDVDLNMDLVRKLYQRSVLPAVQEVAAGKRLNAPLVVDLDPTTVCDLACPECISAGVLDRGQLGRDRIVDLAHEMVAAGVRAVILIGGGEPLLHRGIGEVIDVLAAAGIEIGLVTNGTMIGRYVDRLAEKVSWIRVSMDAGTAETYPLFRPAKRGRVVFPLIVENMRQLAARKRGRLGYSFLLMQRFGPDGKLEASNYGEVLTAAKLAKDIGADYFELKAMLDDDHFTVNQRAEDIALVEEQLAAVREICDDDFRLLVSSNWEAVRVSADPVQPKEYTGCAVAELRTTVTTSGVYVCPYHRGNPKGRIGDVTGMSFAEMWQRADTSVIDPAADCKFVCARHRTNVEIGRFGTGAAAVLDDYDPFI